MTLFCRRPWLPYLIVLIAWIVLHVCSWNTANWSFGDDFAYALPVQSMLQTGQMHYTNWSSMTLVLQVWMGTLLSAVLGFSFDHLRLISMTMQLSAMLALVATSRRLHLHHFWSMVIILGFLFQPLAVELSLCFDTDIPFLGIAFWALYFFIRYLHETKGGDLLLALTFSVTAFLIRDLALVLVAAFAVTILIRDGFSGRSLTIACGSVITMIIAYASWRWWLVNMHGLPANIDFSRNRLLQTWTHPTLLLNSYARNIVYAACYCGIWLTPLSAFLVLRFVQAKRRTEVLMCAALSILLISALLLTPKALTEAGTQLLNQFVPYGDLPSVYVFAEAPLPQAPEWSVTLILLLSSISTAIVMTAIARSVWHLCFDSDGQRTFRYRVVLERLRSRPSLTFLALFIVFYVLLIFSQWMLHRYYLPLLPIIGMLAVSLWSRDTSRPSVRMSMIISTLCIILAYTGLANGHDFMAHQHAIVEAYHYTEDTLHVDSKHFDGGFSYNSLRNYDYGYVAQPQKNWWWVYDADYVLSEAPLAGMHELHRFPYTRWLPPGAEGHIVIQKNVRDVAPRN